MAEEEDNQRRRNHRLSVDIPVKIRFNGITVPGKSANLSCGGIFVKTSAPLPDDARVEVELPLPDGERPLAIRSELVWRHPSSKVEPLAEDEEEEVGDMDLDADDAPGEPSGENSVLDLDAPPQGEDAGSGFKFQSLSPEEKERITLFIKRLMRQDTH